MVEVRRESRDAMPRKAANGRQRDLDEPGTLPGEASKALRPAPMMHCVVIGIDTYRDPRIPNLGAACADAKRFAALLHATIPERERTIQVLLNKQATRTAILEALGETLPQRQQLDDFVLVFFAGHGTPEQGSPTERVGRYLVPCDADYDHLFSTAIGLETQIADILDRQFAFRVLVVVDACFSGAAGGRTFLGAALADRLGKYRTALSLRDLDLGHGRAILTACRDHEVAIEHRDHGVFTKSLIETLCAGTRETIGIGELYDAVFDRVTKHTSNTQHPVLRGEIGGLRLPRLREPVRSSRPRRNRS